MLKQVTVTFNFDPETEFVSDLTCFVDGVEKKKKTTKSAAKKEVVLEDEAIITLEPTKLIFNNKCVADMGIEYQDRIVIKYEKLNKEKKPTPLIGKDISWDAEGSGNKITKTNTVSYRGNANKVLAEYGTEFTIEPYKEGIWKLVSKDPKTVLAYEDVQEQAEEVDIPVFVDDDDMSEIGEISFKL